MLEAAPDANASVDHAELWPDGHLNAIRKPQAQQLPPPRAHADLTTLAALAVAHEDRAAINIEVALSQREHLADPQPPRATSPRSVRATAGHARDRRHSAHD